MAYQTSIWEKIVAVAVAVLAFGLVAFLVVRNTPFADPNLVLLIRTVLSISAGIIGGTIPGFFLHMYWKEKRKTGNDCRTSGRNPPDYSAFTRQTFQARLYSHQQSPHSMCYVQNFP